MKHMKQQTNGKDQTDELLETLRLKKHTHPNSLLNPTILNFPDGSSSVNIGLTKREFFAAMAMQGIAAEYVEIHSKTSSISAHAVAAFSVLLADNLIAELNK